MRKKPSVAGLKRELAQAGLDLADALQDARNANREYELVNNSLDRANETIRDLTGDVKSKDREIGWYERDREETLKWFEDSLKLLAPHLAPNQNNHSIDLAGNDPMERLLIETRQRLSRVYDNFGRYVYTESQRR